MKTEGPAKTKVVRKRTARTVPQGTASLGGVAVAARANPELQKPSLLEFTLWVMYKNLYIMGVNLLRKLLRYWRKTKRLLARIRGSSYSLLEKLGQVLVRFWKNIIRRFKAPFLRISRVYEEVSPELTRARSQGKVAVKPYLRLAWTVLGLFSTIIITIFNYVAPIVAAMVMLYTVNLYINQPLGLAVEYNGEIIGYVENETDFEEAAQTLRSRFITTSSGGITLETPKFTLLGIPPENTEPSGIWDRFLMRLDVAEQGFTKPDELADRMVQASGSAIEQAVGLYIENQFYGAVAAEDYLALADELERIKQANSTNTEGERVEFVKKIALPMGLYPVDSVVERDSLVQVLHSNETVDQVYEVEQGDTPTGIAEKTGVPYSLLLEMNPDIEESLQIGQEIYTEVARPFLSVKNIYKTIYEEEEPYPTTDVETDSFDKGYREVAQAGVPGVREVTAEITAINGIETERIILDTRVISEPVEERVIVGTRNPQTIVSSTTPSSPAAATDMTPSGGQVTSAGFKWPTLGGRVTVPVGGYPGHTGVDIPRPAGTPIYASAAGTVVVAKRTYTGYGHYVTINHGNGFETLYAHATQLYVNVGDKVSQGQVIASVGRTGWATGNHLHFEVRYNGRIMIPQNYVGSSG